MYIKILAFLACIVFSFASIAAIITCCIASDDDSFWLKGEDNKDWEWIKDWEPVE